MNDPNNFRGIPLIDILNKFISGILYGRLYYGPKKIQKLTNHHLVLGKATVLLTYFLLCLWSKSILVRKVVDFIVCL